MNTAVKVQLLGQSIWYDNIRRSLIEDGMMLDWIERREIYGVTSNPSIFSKAIAESDDYDADLQTMSWAGLDPKEIFYRLAIKDIQAVADLFRPYYEASQGADGFVSLEVNPNLAYDTEGTVEEALWLWQKVARPNLMVKIPATEAGLPAITEVIAAGVNVNVTLIFSRKRYRQVMAAYLDGIARRLDEGLDVSQIASVASFFVSRLESKADKRLEELIEKGGEQAEIAQSLMGRIAVANTRLAYRDYEAFFGSDRFKKLAEKGAQKQRPLWASTSTKNPAYSDIKYVESLVAENSVNTVPPETLDAYLDHGNPKITIHDELDKAEHQLERLTELGISLDDITQELEDEGVAQFADAFKELLDVIEARRRTYVEGLASLAEAVSSTLKTFKADDVIGRMHRFDPILWTDDADGKSEIQKRLGWLGLPEESQSLIQPLYDLADTAIAEGFEKVLLLGMGGSSLAPETIYQILEEYLDGLELRILDSTIPESIRKAEKWVDYKKTLFIVSSKSGTTTETMSFYKYFWDRAEAEIGGFPGDQFIAITDPGSSLAKLGVEKGFRQVFTANPNVGGRYSAFTHFGLVPAVLMGVDLEQLLWDASEMAQRCSEQSDLETNPGAVLGIILGIAAKSGKNKLTLIADVPIAPFGAWLEQLVAESSGKDGRGIVPITDEPVLSPDTYGSDRIFVYLRATGDQDGFLETLRAAGHPVLVLDLDYLYGVFGEMFRWEFAIAIACSILGVNAFNQPDVQDNKARTKTKIQCYLETGQLDEPDVVWHRQSVQVFGIAFEGLDQCKSVAEVIDRFAGLADDGDFIALNAYLPRNPAIEAKLNDSRERILKKTGKATSLGFGPRFLHSTGQLHKGGANNGVFLQITQEDTEKIEIPGKGYSFSILARAQAQGDLEALLSRERRAIRIHLPAEAPFEL